MEPKFNPPVNGYDAELLCPKCRSEYLHHYRTEVFERKEDAQKGLHVIV